MDWLVLTSMIILASYIVAVCAIWGVPESVSQTFFSIGNKWIFSAVVAVSVALLFQPMVEALPVGSEFLAFLTCAGGVMVAFAPNLNDVMEYAVHMTGAVVLGLASQIAVLLICPMALVFWLLAFLVLEFPEKRVFIAEIIGGAALYLSLTTC